MVGLKFGLRLNRSKKAAKFIHPYTTRNDIPTVMEAVVILPSHIIGNAMIYVIMVAKRGSAPLLKKDNLLGNILSTAKACNVRGAVIKHDKAEDPVATSIPSRTLILIITLLEMKI